MPEDPGRMNGFRGFIAVEVEVGKDLMKALEDLQKFGRPLKPVSPENVHVTLKFLGTTLYDKLPEIERAIEEAVKGIPPFSIQLRGTGAFPNPRKPRVVWAGMRGAEPLATVARRLEEGLEPLGFPKEGRAFSPHLTLARVREGHHPDLNDFLREHADTDFGTTRVSSIKLKKSVLRPDGPEYSDVLEVHL